MSTLHEECGVFGVFAPKPINVASLAYYGLYALQHRGQESCGIVVNDDGIFGSHKDLGLVSEVFTPERLARFPEASMAVGHVRYGTTGGNNRTNCQPIEVNHQKGKLALAHNGNLSNAYQLRNELELKGAIFHTTSDTETIAYIITRERLSAPHHRGCGQRRHGYARRGVFALSDVIRQDDRRPRSLRLPSALLRADRGRHVYHCFRKLRSQSGGCNACP